MRRRDNNYVDIATNLLILLDILVNQWIVIIVNVIVTTMKATIVK